MATDAPSEDFKEIIEFLMKIYAPTWFEIKIKPSITLGAKHLFKLIQKIPQLRERSQPIVKAVVKNNAYFAHPENILLAMVYDENPAIRKLGWQRILKAKEAASRTSDCKPTHGKRKRKIRREIRYFTIPTINFQANCYHDIIDWNTISVTVPPLLRGLSQQEIIANINSSKSHFSDTVKEMPCHTQAVERLVKVVTEASTAVASDVARDGYIRNVFKSRAEYSKLESKKHFV